jgi:hypothetical protein
LRKGFLEDFLGALLDFFFEVFFAIALPSLSIQIFWIKYHS